jgi:hypothetical protein
MFDEMSYVNGKQSYYSTLNSYVDSLGMSVTIGNPGTATISSYVGTLNTLDIYENPGLPSVSSIQSATFDGAYGNSNFAMIALSVPMPSQTYLQSVSGCVAWVFFTDAGPRTAYSTLPSYFMTEVSMLSATPVTSCV